MKSKIVLLIIFIILLASVFGLVLYKPSIHTVTFEELTDIRGIDKTLATRVIIYIKSNPDADIDDLDDIYGFGEYRVNLIRRKWGD